MNKYRAKEISGGAQPAAQAGEAPTHPEKEDRASRSLGLETAQDLASSTNMLECRYCGVASPQTAYKEVQYHGERRWQCPNPDCKRKVIISQDKGVFDTWEGEAEEDYGDTIPF